VYVLSVPSLTLSSPSVWYSLFGSDEEDEDDYVSVCPSTLSVSSDGDKVFIGSADDFFLDFVLSFGAPISSIVDFSPVLVPFLLYTFGGGSSQ
jgi:hypothetical protein